MTVENCNWTNIVVLTGAGISQESGLQTFRDADGLWEGHRFEEVATPEAFAANPGLVHSFYNKRRAQLKEVTPNKAHKALADFEKKFQGSFSLITQNVDDLHEKAGSKNVIHMHGELKKIKCIRTGKVFPWEEDLGIETPHPENSEITGTLRPDIVWFGEFPYHMDKIESLLKQCDLFVAIGTSGNVYPAAGFVNWVPQSCHCVEINKEETQLGHKFHQKVTGLASQTVPEFFDFV